MFTQAYVICLASAALMAPVQDPPLLRMWPLLDPVNPPELELFTFLRHISSYWTRAFSCILSPNACVEQASGHEQEKRSYRHYREMVNVELYRDELNV